MSSTKSSQPPAAPGSHSLGCAHSPSGPYEQEKATDDNPSLELFPNLSPPSFQYNASLHPLDTTSPSPPTITSPHVATPQSAGLRLQTEHLSERKREESASSVSSNPISETSQTVFNAGLPVRSSSIRSAFSSRHRADSLTPSSALSSPGVGPLADMTPLPSPISGWGSPGYGRRSIDEEMGDATPIAITAEEDGEVLPEPMDFSRASSKKRKIPLVARDMTSEQAQIYNANAAAYAKNRSVSEYVPEGMQIPRSRNIVVSTSGGPPVTTSLSPLDDHMHREQYLAIQRGLAISIPKPPTPPDSNRGAESADHEFPPLSPKLSQGPLPLLYEAYMVRGGKLRRWRGLRQLGKGTFSTVMLATSEGMNKSITLEENQVRPKSLVAVKICEQGPAGGADEKKMKISIKRELEIMKSIHHPSLVHLKAVKMCEQQTFLILGFCAGGDLFELASLKLEILMPSLIRRMFSELVAAVRYLHLQYIVHRDIKLENVLVNIPTPALTTTTDNWQTYPAPIVTLTDLGLGRWIPRPPESPLLDTRCGSEDYAAPEVLIGQEYDGRATDAWALGVLLYAIMEGRLPFDPIPGARRKSPTSHRIARCEWQWVRYADAEGEWDGMKGKELEGARDVVEGLLARARSRWTLEKVQEKEWVKGGVQVPGGLRMEEEDESYE
ncbi:hypothetical protein HO133_010296 [Letharia lupina]|uniref:Protein kinase domain-containing protein n=1 Tax=Letharia lupina TaxID=560253 RepID=A0A8H6CKN7_9LECA|nr:uncharacterized protein HO133_010296 [Letharia lupina]KAF6225100.1 hypothetical protein HO133_010296 [Letharia lupina]